MDSDHDTSKSGARHINVGRFELHPFVLAGICDTDFSRTLLFYPLLRSCNSIPMTIYRNIPFVLWQYCGTYYAVKTTIRSYHSSRRHATHPDVPTQWLDSSQTLHLLHVLCRNQKPPKAVYQNRSSSAASIIDHDSTIQLFSQPMKFYYGPIQ
jgi:hypothetical protein